MLQIEKGSNELDSPSRREMATIFHTFRAEGFKLYYSPVKVSSPLGKQSCNFTIVEVLWMPFSPVRLSPAEDHLYFN
jgi:hypothetical protein